MHLNYEYEKTLIGCFRFILVLIDPSKIHVAWDSLYLGIHAKHELKRKNLNEKVARALDWQACSQEKVKELKTLRLGFFVCVVIIFQTHAFNLCVQVSEHNWNFNQAWHSSTHKYARLVCACTTRIPWSLHD